MRRAPDNLNIPETKARLSAAFKSLRALGYVARQNFMCCQGCAWSALADKGLTSGDRVVFFHRQDASDLNEFGEVHLAWAGDGKQICLWLAHHGLSVEWDGTEEHRIFVRPVLDEVQP